MITCNLNVLLAERNMKITELAKMTGISRTTLTSLAYNKSKGIQFETLDSICSSLRIKPNDVFKQEIFDYEFKVIDVSSLSLSKYKNDFFINNDGTVFETEFIVNYKNNIIREIMGINIHFPSAYSREDRIVLPIELPLDYEQSDVYKAVYKIPVPFKSAFYNELVETIRTYSSILNYSETHMSPQQIDNCLIRINE